MPQMAPYSWLLLMLMFSMIFIIFNSMLYYIKPLNKPNSSKGINKFWFTPKW